MKTQIVRAALAMLAIAVAASSARGQEEQKVSFWMQKKLEYSERILAGLTSENFAEIDKAARSMNALGQMEKWVRAGSPGYRGHLRAFQRANEQLIDMAEEQNLDGAAAAFVQLTLSCVNCHKIVRDGKPARPAAKQAPAAK
jgi:hypothetical protein